MADTEQKILEHNVSDVEGIYMVAEAYAVLRDSTSALRLLRHTIENGFFRIPIFSVIR